MPGVSNAVFLSYASEDAEAAERIATALRAAGVEVWFDKSELRGGDAWDRQIREQIRDCALFVPIISVNSQARPEGYFRLEWDLADQRTHLMGRNRAFVMPLCLDATPQREADVPDSFLAAQWTRLPAGAEPAAFVERVQRLLSGESSATRGAAAAPGAALPRLEISPSAWPRRALMLGAAVVIAGVVGYLALERPWASKPTPSPTAPVAVPAAFAPPPHSIAVLPFVNLSGDKEQEYFSDGLTEELLNSLSQINDLQVAARTSAFSFKGSNTDLGTIAHKLNVAAVLEGSVRRSEHTMRVTAQLINAVTGFHLWSKTYDRDIGDVLKLQTEIATAVAEALKVTLLGDIAQKIELGGTRNPAAFDAYLRASKAFQSRHEDKDIPAAIAAYTEAIGLDPNFALAFAGRSNALAQYSGQVASGAAVREGFEKAERDAQQAITLAPELAEAHAALAGIFNDTLDFPRASEEYERALALAPGNAEILGYSGRFAAWIGHFESGIAAARRAVELDPLDRRSHIGLGWALYAARHYAESAAAFSEAISLNPDFKPAHGDRGRVFYLLGDLQKARASCEVHRDDWASQWCLAMVYDKLGRRADAAAELSKMKSAIGDAGAVQYTIIYAQWGDRSKALEWLETAMRLRDPGLEGFKTDPLFDPLRQEPRFQAMLRELRFPD
jgi:TolB-like protein/Tfp pilus assembly protein PilF